jgi:hypothetical protein
VRLIFGAILKAGVTWQGIFYIGAAAMFCIWLEGWFFLKRDPTEIGEQVTNLYRSWSNL